MAIRREDASSKLKDIQIGYSWIPTTPAKPCSTNQQPICANWQENRAVEANLLKSECCIPVNLVTQANICEPGKLTEDFLQGTQCQTAPACYTSTNHTNVSRGSNNRQAGIDTNSHGYEDILSIFDTWQAGEAASSRVYGEDSYKYDKFPIKDADQWATMSFGDLLALADAKGKKAAKENVLAHNTFATSSTSASYFHPHIEGSRLEDVLAHTNDIATSSTSGLYSHPQFEGSQFTISFANSSQQDQGSLVGANFDARLKLPNFVMSGSSIPSRHIFDLNSPPRKNTGAVLRQSPSQFEPITPVKTNKSEYRQESAMQDLCIDEVPTEKENKITMDGVMELHEKKQATCTELQENHKPDKGGTEEADLSKTPQQKTRKKKHRPKVIIEGQNKGTPKSRAEKHSVPQDNMRVKRKYVRKNQVNTPSGGGITGTDLENKTRSSTGTPVGKRKYTRRKKVNKTEDDMDEGTTETKEIYGPRRTRRSCRRSLNFDSDGQVRDGTSSHCLSSNCERESHAENFNTKDQPRTVHCTEEMKVVVEKNDIVTSHELTHSMNQVQEDYLSRPEEHSQSPLPYTSKDAPQDNHMLADQIVCTRGKCQIVFSDVTHDKEANTVQVSMKSDSQLTPKSPSDSICSSTSLTLEKQVRGLKRHNTDTTIEAEPYNTNEAGKFYNSLQAYLPIFSPNIEKINSTPGLHFPPIYKKKRTEKVYSMVTSSMQITASTSDNHSNLERHTLRASCTKLFTSPTNQGSSGGLGQVTNFLMTNHATGSTQNGRKVFEDLLALGPTQRIRKRRSKGPTRRRDIASLLDELPASSSNTATTSRIKQDIEILHGPHTCMEALVADTRSTMITKKRSKRSMLINSTVQNLYNHQKCAATSLGAD